MKKDKKIAHTQNELITIFKQQKIRESLLPKFLSLYKSLYNEFYEEMKDYEDDDFEEEDSIQSDALFCTNLYIKPFFELTENGHGEEWANLIAESREEDETKTYYTFNELKKSQPELAQKELVLHCNNLSKDEDFRRYYLFLFGLGEGFEEPYERAIKYAQAYKEQIKKGKSKLFAHEYAEYANSNYNEIYKEEYAYAYEKAILAEKSEEYARVFADKYGSDLVNIKRRVGISDDEGLIDYAIEKVSSFMKAWEYVSEHKIKDSDRFHYIYEHEYLNTYFANNGMPKGTLEEIDKAILKKVLLEYNKL